MPEFDVLSPYRRILSVPGALAFSSTGLLARLPISMVSLGIVLLVTSQSGSYGLAGAVSAAYVLASAAFSPMHGRLTDRFGQHAELPTAITVFGAGLAGLMVAVVEHWPSPVPHLFAVVTGAALPQVGSCVRARWSYLLVGDRRALSTAYSFEAVIDEAVFMVGPVAVTLLATRVHPLAGLATALGCGVLGTWLLAGQRRTEPPVGGEHHAWQVRLAMPWRVLTPVVVASAALGTLFGSVEVVTVAFAQENGHRAASGPLLATWALGSLLAGLVTGLVRWRSTPDRRFRLGMTAMALTMVPLPLLPNLVALGAVLFVAGFAISPTLVATVSVVEAGVPPARLTEGISWVTTGLAAGVAPGAAVSGRVVDAAGASAGYLVPLAAGVVAAAVAWSGPRPAPPAAPSPHSAAPSPPRHTGAVPWSDGVAGQD